MTVTPTMLDNASTVAIGGCLACQFSLLVVQAGSFNLVPKICILRHRLHVKAKYFSNADSLDIPSSAPEERHHQVFSACDIDGDHDHGRDQTTRSLSPLFLFY